MTSLNYKIALMAGTLYVVATPIGNLEDITLRALRVLKEVDVVAAEDTRRTLKLLNHYGISKPLVSVREHNEVKEAARLVSRIERGEDIALVSDAGTPGIADPGAKVVHAARLAGIAVTAVPGPCALVAALSISGMEVDQFTFAGFPPAGLKARREWLRELMHEERAIVFYESPHRIESTLEVMRKLVERPIYVLRELTKIHEGLVIHTNNAFESGKSIPEQVNLGEFVVIVQPIGSGQASDGLSKVDMDSIVRLNERIIGIGGIDQNGAALATAGALGIHVRSVRKALKLARYLENAQDRS